MPKLPQDLEKLCLNALGLSEYDLEDSALMTAIGKFQGKKLETLDLDLTPQWWRNQRARDTLLKLIKS